MIVSLLSACGTKTTDITGDWMDKDGHILNIREDGSYKLEGDYGTGKWKFLDDNKTIEFTDFYGDTTETIVSENTFGKYIKLDSYGDFYKESYPTINDIETDVFEDITLDISGASPFCYVSLNKEKVDEFINEFVDFGLEMENNYGKAGETITVTANMYGKLASQIPPKTKEFSINDVSVYIERTDDLDTDVLNKICEDYLISEMDIYNSSGDSKLFENLYSGRSFINHNIIEYGLILRNSNHMNGFNPKTYVYNTYYCLYEIESFNHSTTSTENLIVEVLLTNICKTPDGEYKWYVHSEDVTENDIKGGCYDTVSGWARDGRYYDYYYSDSYDVSSIYYNKDFDGTKFN